MRQAMDRFRDNSERATARLWNDIDGAQAAAKRGGCIVLEQGVGDSEGATRLRVEVHAPAVLCNTMRLKYCLQRR